MPLKALLKHAVNVKKQWLPSILAISLFLNMANSKSVNGITTLVEELQKSVKNILLSF